MEINPYKPPREARREMEPPDNVPGEREQFLFFKGEWAFLMPWFLAVLFVVLYWLFG